ncbi:MAG: beta-galactosidase, partial [Calditrichaeota bacterium]|nr:beta-galactosidase [Calditrichota bacterium]
RGKHDAAVFPLTGHPPMDVDGWRGLYRIAKNWGINHYRFHSWCPPEAAFTAADLEGIYLQAELPFWGGLESDSVAALLRAEGLAMLDAYGNHPSLVMFSHGNEIWSGHERVEANIIALKEHDPRPLYTMGSNNNIGYVPPRPCCDFFVCARTPFEKDTTLTHTRLTHAYVDSRDGGILNTRTPSTQVNFDVPVSRIDIPLISHEIGQYQVFPDYREIDKYTGVLRAWNLEVFRKRLAKAGMADLDLPFHRASGAWSALCYKAEMEAALRTAGMGGFQLLDLQDFPGQGTALVGMLDAFMDSKGIITPEQWRESCDAVVLLMEFPKYCWTSGETLAGTAAVANYGPVPLRGDIAWHLRRADGTVMAQGLWANPIAPAGGLSTIGRFEAALPELRHPEKLRLEIALSGGSITNSYPLWVYPAAPPPAADEVLVSQTLSDQARSVLAAGGKILLFPRGEELGEGAIPGLFPPDFWNYGMFKGISEWAKKPVSPGTLGLLTDPGHPLFGDFPTDFHSNWQWFSIVRGGYAMVLDDLPAGYRPIVQVIDNLERNHKLGLIFECRVGAGKLLVCMAPLDRLVDKIEAVWLYRSILNYMNSAAFAPEQELDPGLLGGVFQGKKCPPRLN